MIPRQAVHRVSKFARQAGFHVRPLADLAAPRRRVGRQLIAAAVLGTATASWWIATASADSEKPRTLDLNELVKHSHGADLWVAIDGNVWDLTEFHKSHPGGPSIILEHGGQDVSTLFHQLHPEGSLQTHISPSKLVGRLDEQGQVQSRSIKQLDADRVRVAREALPGVDSVVTLNDFESYARPLLSPEAWQYYSFGAETEAGLRNNESAYDRIFFRPRVMRDVSEIKLGPMSCAYIAPYPSTQRQWLQWASAMNRLGEIATTRAAANQGILRILSFAASKSVEEVMEARQEGQEVGWQLYMNSDRAKAAESVRRAVAAGAQSIWLTIDRQVNPKNHRKLYAARPIPSGTPLAPESPTTVPQIDITTSWKDFVWLKELAPGLPIVVKGLGAWEDVELARAHGASAVVLSNHGGRQLDFAHAPIQTLYDLHRHSPDTLSHPDFDVYIDGGIRRGSDVVKALCLGAKAVGVGRPFIYSATAWGSEGVEKAIQILRQEIDIAMRGLGVTRVDQLGPQYIDCSKL